jgi:hypothetical protein
MSVTGIAAAHRSTAVKTLAVASIATASLFNAGCTADDEGTVRKGADGKDYVLPDDAQRPQYQSREDCIADVTEQIAKLKAQGENVGDNPADLCEPASNYAGHYAHPWVGPIIWGAGIWHSPRVAGWSQVTDGGFGANGAAKLQPDVIQKAPAGAKAGSRAPLKGGFGGSGKSGFGSHAGGGSGAHVSVGG